MLYRGMDRAQRDAAYGELPRQRLDLFLADNPAEARRNSPILNLPPMAGPLIVTYATAELPELCRQSTSYATAWAGHGLPGRLLPIEGVDHFTILESLARPDGERMRALLTLARA